MRLGTALLLAVFVLAASGAEATLPAPPFALDVSPARVAAGESVLLQVTPRGGSGEFDLYIMWALAPEAAFLTPEGVWSPRPVAFRAGVPAAGAPISLRWVPGPPGEIPLALVVLPRGGDPLARFAWTFRPVLAWISARPPAPAVPLDLLRLAPLAAVTLLSCGIVLLAGRLFLA
jgi:hypothetical protein